MERAAVPASLDLALKAAAERLEGLTETPRLDAEVLLMQVLGQGRTYLRTWPERWLTEAQAASFHDLIERRAEGAPIAYLAGEREFWSRSFTVRPGALIPRPETELLVELALSFIPADLPTDVLDLGTGSGAIAVTLAAERPEAQVTAIDLSPDALDIARENAVRQGVGERVRCLLGDWFAPLPTGERFDVIVSNPPYIAENDPHLGQGDLRHEPALALASGPKGLDALTAIADTARAWLKPGGWLLLEHGYDQAPDLAALLTGFGYLDIAHHLDLQGHTRATTARWNSPS